TPRSFSCGVSELILFSAPRALKEPVRWKSSHLIRAFSVRLVSVGVLLSRVPIVARARSKSSRVGSIRATLASRVTLADGLEEQNGRGGARVQRVGGSAAHRDRDTLL